MRLLRKLMVFALIVIIPVMIVCLSANIVLRAPDVIQYSLKSTEVLNQQNIDAEEDVVGELFSDYMLHKLPEFQMNQGVDGEEELLFSRTDQMAMENLRKIVDISAIAGIALLVIILIIYIYLIRNDYKEALRWAFVRAIPLMVILVIASVVIFNVPAAADFVYGHGFNVAFAEMDTLPLIMDSTYAKALIFVGNIANAVLMTLCGYVTWKLTKPKRMFW